MLSCNEEVFNEAKPMYQRALELSGYSYELKYEKINTQVSATPADFVSLNATISCTEIVPQSTKKTKSGDIADT